MDKPRLQLERALESGDSGQFQFWAKGHWPWGEFVRAVEEQIRQEGLNIPAWVVRQAPIKQLYQRAVPCHDSDVVTSLFHHSDAPGRGSYPATVMDMWFPLGDYVGMEHPRKPDLTPDDMAELMREKAMRCESLFHLALAGTDPMAESLWAALQADGAAMLDALMFPDHVRRQADEDIGQSGDSIPQMMARYGRQGFLAKFSTPVPKVTGPHRGWVSHWSHTVSQWFYGDTLTAAVNKGLIWRDNYIEDEWIKRHA